MLKNVHVLFIGQNRNHGNDPRLGIKDNVRFMCERDTEVLAEDFWDEARKLLSSAPNEDRIQQARELLQLCYELRNKPLAWLNRFHKRYVRRT